MLSNQPSNSEKLRHAFEGAEAIYIEKGVLRVRVTGIRCSAKARRISAQVEEIVRTTDGQSTLRWIIDAGYLTRFSHHTWHMGYGGWSLFFAPEMVSRFVSLAAEWPAEFDALERYDQALRFLGDNGAYEPSIRVFPGEAS
jgi:hypothetical protein